MDPPRLYGLLGLMLLIWSANFIFVKLALRDAPPLLVFCVRTALAGLFITPVYLASSRGSDVRSFGARDLPRLFAVGGMGIVCNQMLFVLALGRTSVAHAALIAATSPVLVLALTIASGQERMTGRKLAGVLAALLGVAVLQLGKVPAGAPSAAGDLMILGSAALLATFSVVGKRAASEFGSLALNAVAFWGGGLLALPYAVWGVWRIGPASIGPMAWAGIVFLSVSSFAGYVIYSYALRHLPASRVSGITYLQPPLATLLAILFLGEQPGWPFAIGAAATLGGVWLAQRR